MDVWTLARGRNDIHTTTRPYFHTACPRRV
jgi:hypothetical protein